MRTVEKRKTKNDIKNLFLYLLSILFIRNTISTKEINNDSTPIMIWMNFDLSLQVIRQS